MIHARSKCIWLAGRLAMPIALANTCSETRQPKQLVAQQQRQHCRNNHLLLAPVGEANNKCIGAVYQAHSLIETICSCPLPSFWIAQSIILFYFILCDHMRQPARGARLCW